MQCRHQNRWVEQEASLINHLTLNRSKSVEKVFNNRRWKSTAQLPILVKGIMHMHLSSTKFLSVSISSKLSAMDHVSIYNHLWMCSNSACVVCPASPLNVWHSAQCSLLNIIYQAVVIAKLTRAASISRGFTNSDDCQHIEAFVCRQRCAIASVSDLHGRLWPVIVQLYFEWWNTVWCQMKDMTYISYGLSNCTYCLKTHIDLILCLRLFVFLTICLVACSLSADSSKHLIGWLTGMGQARPGQAKKSMGSAWHAKLSPEIKLLKRAEK